MMKEWNDTVWVVEILSDKSGSTACLTGVSTALKIPLNDAYIKITAIGIDSKINVSPHSNAVTTNDDDMVILNKYPLSYLSAIDPAQTLSSKIGTSRQKFTKPKYTALW